MSVGLVSISVKQISKNKIKFSDSVNKLLNDLENEISKQIDNYICNPNVQNSIGDVQKYAETIVTNLNNLINKKNKLSKTLNDLIKIFKTLTKIIDVTTILVTALEVSIQVLKLLPIPNQFTTVGLVLTLSDVLELVKVELNKIKSMLTQLKSILDNFLNFIRSMLDKLKVLDGLFFKLNDKIKQCLLNRNISSVNITTIDNVAIYEDLPVSNLEEYTYKNFKFSIKIDNNNTTKYLKRYAVALNTYGVIVLKGESSFTSDPQILIEELKFIIDKDNLKAN